MLVCKFKTFAYDLHTEQQQKTKQSEINKCLKTVGNAIFVKA
jgi:hypothetical protein